MGGIDPRVITHRLNIDPSLINQKRRKLRKNRLMENGIIREVQYPDWLANPVVVPKKNGKMRVCIDFTNLNKACPKDSSSPPHRSDC